MQIMSYIRTKVVSFIFKSDILIFGKNPDIR